MGNLCKELIACINYMYIYFGVQNIDMLYCMGSTVRMQRFDTSGLRLLDVQILKGVVSKYHMHPHLSYPPKLSISDLVKRLKGRSAILMLDEFSELKRRYWDQYLWGIGYGAWSTGNITDEMVQKYLNHHKEGPNTDPNFILE